MAFQATSNVPTNPNQIDRLVIRVLWPLRALKAKLFEVEINTALSQGVWKTLGDVNFVVAVKERGYNLDLYGESPSLRL